MLPAKSLSTLLTSSRISFLNEKTLDLITLHFKKMSNRKRTTGNGFVKRWWFFSQVQNVPTTQHGCSSQFCNFTPPKTWSKIWSNSTPSSIYDAVSFSLPCCNVAILLLQKQLKMHLFRGDFFPFFFQETNCKSCYAWIKDAKETHKRRKNYGSQPFSF